MAKGTGNKKTITLKLNTRNCSQNKNSSLPKI